MGDQDTSGIDSCSSDSHDTSVSDGEILKYSSMRTKSDHQTTTDLGKYEGLSGIQLLNILPISHGFNSLPYLQLDHHNKLPRSGNVQLNRASARIKVYNPYIQPREDQGPKFDFNSWNVEGPPGIQFLSLLPLHQEERKLRQAANTDDFMTVLRLLDNGVDSRCMDEKKRTPLHFAASRGNSQIVSLLLDRGAEPNQKDAIGNTPLHLAACTNHIEVVTLLLKAGTDIHALDNSGRSPLHLAQSRFRILQRDPKFTEETATGFKEKITQVTDMMQAYLKVSNKSDNVDVEQLNGLCEKLQLSSTKAEVDLVNDMLADFTQLTIQKKKPG